jgi:hypothetical protein
MNDYEKRVWEKEKKLSYIFVQGLNSSRTIGIFDMIIQQYDPVNLDKPAQYGGLPTEYVKKRPVSGGKRKTKKNKRKSRRQKTL